MGRCFSEILELQCSIFSARKVGCFLLQQVHPYSNKGLYLTLIGYQAGGGWGGGGVSSPDVIIILLLPKIL